MFSAMLPDQKPERGAVVPAPVNAATLVADAHLRLGKALAKAGKKDEARQHYAAAANLGPMRMAGIPQIGNSKGDTNFTAGVRQDARRCRAQGLRHDRGMVRGPPGALASASPSVLSELKAKDVDLYLHQQAVDTSTPAGRALFQMLGVFAELELRHDR
jgi:Resolvase, N terminal domain